MYSSVSRAEFCSSEPSSPLLYWCFLVLCGHSSANLIASGKIGHKNLGLKCLSSLYEEAEPGPLSLRPLVKGQV